MPALSGFAELDLLVDALETCAHPAELDDTEGFVLFVNRAWCELFGHSLGDLVGAKWDSLSPAGADSAGLRTSWDRCLVRGRAEGQLLRRSVDSTRLPISYTRMLFWDNERDTGVVVTLFRPLPSGDATEESVSQADSASLEHRLRNLLTVVTINLELVDSAVDDPVVKRRLELMRGAVQGTIDLFAPPQTRLNSSPGSADPP